MAEVSKYKFICVLNISWVGLNSGLEEYGLNEYGLNEYGLNAL